MPRLSVVIVTFNSAEAVRQGLPALLDQLADGDELIVADNASRDGTAELVGQLVPQARLLRRPNDGFAAACNEAAELARGDVLVLLNPDTLPAPGWADAIRRPGPGWDAWMGLVTMDGGRRVNTSGGVIHFTGVAWAGQATRPVEEAPGEPREVAFASGACLAIPVETWRATGGFPEHYFMYFEDVDLSLRIRLRGGRVGIEPSARVDHEYDFAKGGLKWRMLERNRWATVLRCYPGPLLALLLPALLVTDLAIWAAALSDGWAREKAQAWRDVLVALPRLLRERRAIQRERAIGSAEFARFLTADLDSPFLGAAASSGLIRGAVRLYWRVVTTLLR